MKETVTTQSIEETLLASPALAIIGGSSVPGLREQVSTTLNPANGQLIAEVAELDATDVDRAVQDARTSFESGAWSAKSPGERKTTLLAFADLIEANAPEIALLDTIDAGKPIIDTTETDLPDVIHTIRWYAELADKDFGKVSPAGLSSLGLTVREPVGVVGAVLPWNFPASMLAWKIGPALAAGNSVIVKPPELAPLSTIRIAQLALEAGIPEGVLNVVPGRGEIAGRALGLHPEVDMITFTGSSEVGRAFLGYSAASNLKKIVLEMGGKSPQVVLPDVDDLDAVATQLATAGFWNGGQNCTCGSRIIVHESMRDDLVEALIRASRDWTVGNPRDAATRVGPMIEEAALTRILAHIDGARQDGATVALGGGRMLQETGGWYVEPTILTDVRADMDVAREEIFGPVVSVLTYRTEAEAIAMANDTVYGLHASVYTNNLDAAFRVSRAVRAGTVSVNGFSEGDITTPFGGYRQSGFGGRDKGAEALDQYTELKAIWMELKA
ncbi:aldehyde dehydrogenase [Subtercola sp. YIM 133946]|uniref:aldehyde dehydrogenase n=1 Tax=Subtercola sp. YIM 133946 TaxID=3118909 RepID=UPI002F9510C0